MGYSIRRQTHLIRAQLAGALVMVGCSGYGSADAERAGLAHLGGTGAAMASVIGCSGTVECENGFEALEIAGPGGGIKFGSTWQSRILPRLGDYPPVGRRRRASAA